MSLSVISAIPASGAIDVSIATNFEWKFYNPNQDNNWIVTSLDGISGVITDDMVVITDGNDNPVGGEVSTIYTEGYTALSSGLLFAPDESLQYATTYTLTLPGSPSGVYGIPDGETPISTDFLAGSGYTYTFTTVDQPTVPPPTDPTTSGSNVVVQSVHDSAIVLGTTHGRCVGPQGGVANNSQFLIEEDGTLSALVFINRDNIVLRKSTDNGFSWTDKDNDAIWSTSNGELYMPNDQGYGPRLTLIKNTTNGYYQCHSYDGKLYTHSSVADQASHTVWGYTMLKYQSTVPGKYFTYFATKPMDPYDNYAVVGDYIAGGYFASDSFSYDLTYLAYAEQNNKLTVMGQNLETTSYGNIIQDYNPHPTKTIVKGALAVRSWRDKLNIVYVAEGDVLEYMPYAKLLGTLFGTGYTTGEYGTAVPIKSGQLTGQARSFVEPTLAVDGLGNLCTHYTFLEDDYYSISTDKGATWTSIYSEPPSGYIIHTDILVDEIAPSNDVIGLASGFLISTVFENDSLSPDLFVKEVPAHDLIEGTSTIDWNRVNSITGDVIAGKFFRFTNEIKPHSNNKDSIRMVYQVGRNNEINGLGTNLTTVYQERVTNLAFPDEFQGTSFTATNIDYYAAGHTSANTTLYMSKIGEIGMDYSFTRYDPIANSTISGKSGYETIVTREIEAVIDPGSYGFPTVAGSDADFQEYIARDNRKLFYKPDTFLDREFILNKAGTLKRTVWTVRIMGNDYEVAQIVPRWVDGAIVYYEANLYVIGPSNDPFTKVILPSES